MALTEQEAESLYKKEFGEEAGPEVLTFAEEEEDLAAGVLQEDDDPFEPEEGEKHANLLHPHEHRGGFEEASS